MTLNLQDGLLKDVIDRAETAAAVADRIKIDRRSDREKVLLRTDLDRLTQVFINLIANAAKYCANEEPRLRIKVAYFDGGLMVDVIDNGDGIPAAKQALIFEKFSRLSDHSAAGGAGLGLAICRRLWSIWVVGYLTCLDKVGRRSGWLPPRHWLGRTAQ